MKILAVLLFLAIAAFAIALRAGWRPSWRRTPQYDTDKEKGGNHGSPAKKSQGTLYWVIVAALSVFVLILVLVAVLVTTSIVQTFKATPPAQKQVAVQFPVLGSGRATKEAPLQAYLDPRRTYTRPSGPARYVSLENPQIIFDEDEKPDPIRDQLYWQLPAGNYLVYPRGVEEIEFHWWQ